MKYWDDLLDLEHFTKDAVVYLLQSWGLHGILKSWQNFMWNIIYFSGVKAYIISDSSKLQDPDYQGDVNDSYIYLKISSQSRNIENDNIINKVWIMAFKA